MADESVNPSRVAPIGDSLECPRCGGTLEAGASEGALCPRCLLALAFIVPDRHAEGLSIGQLLGPYRIIRPLGEGGMGLVYMAEQQHPIQRQVALKVLKRGMDTREVLARFDSERQALALMDHSNIARVFDAGSTEDGRPFFVMEYLEGAPITEYCDRRRLSIPKRLDLFIKVCHAVHHAHQKGMLHRDLKPSNVLVVELDGKPEPKVIDFGLAKALDRKVQFRSTLTEYGVLVGTPEYMSPEQLAGGQAVDTRTDIYSLGVLLYELLVGTLPFDAKRLREAGVEELSRVIRRDDPPKPSRRLSSLGAAAARIAEARGTEVGALARSLRGELEWITLKALEKQPSRRYGSASELATDVASFLQDEPVSAGPQRPSYRLFKFVRKHWTAAAATVTAIISLAAVAVVSTALYVRAERSRHVAVREQYLAAISAAALNIGDGDPSEARRRLLACEPSLRGWEWRHLMYRADPTLRVLQASGTLSRSTSQAGFAFAEGGRRLLWHSGTSLNAWLEGSAQTSRTSIGPVLAVHSEGGRSASRDAGGKLHVASLDPEREVAILDPGEHVIGSAAFDRPAGRLATGSEDGRLQIWDITGKHLQLDIPAHPGRIACVRFIAGDRNIVTSGEDSTIRTWDSASGKLLATVTQAASASWVFDFVPNEKWIMYPSRDGEVANRNARVRIQSMLNGAVIRTYPSPEDIAGVAFNAGLNGNQYAFVSRSGELHLCDEASGCTILVRQTGDPLNSVAFSPEGAVVYTGSESGEVCAWDAVTRGGTLLPTPEGEARAIVIDPADERIIAGVDSHVDVWAASSGYWLARWGSHGAVVNDVAAAPSGSMFASASDDRTARVWSRDGRRVATLAGHSSRVTAVTFSPDSATVATASEDRSVRIWDAHSGRQLALLAHSEPVSAVRFSPDGSWLASGSGGSNAVQLWDVRRGVTNRSLTFATARTYSSISAVAFTPNGSRVLAARATDGAIGVWDVRSGRMVATMTGHSAGPGSLTFNPDGSRLASGSPDQTVRIWDAASFEQLLVLRGNRKAVRRVIFSLDGSRLFAAGDGIRMWPTREGMRWPSRRAPESH
jgi:eukaryotic-like serine/threonine-protein kinase